MRIKYFKLVRVTGLLLVLLTIFQKPFLEASLGRYFLQFSGFWLQRSWSMNLRKESTTRLETALYRSYLTPLSLWSWSWLPLPYGPTGLRLVLGLRLRRSSVLWPISLKWQRVVVTKVTSFRISSFIPGVWPVVHYYVLWALWHGSYKRATFCWKVPRYALPGVQRALSLHLLPMFIRAFLTANFYIYFFLASLHLPFFAGSCL